MKHLVFLLILLITDDAVYPQQSGLMTWFEKTGGLETPRYSETMAYCKELSLNSPAVSFTTFGTSGQGRDLPLLIVDRDGLVSSEEIKKKGRIIVMIQACIHPGESDGKDAGLMLLRDMVTEPFFHGGKLRNNILEHVSILFIPIFNVDGHERFSPYNRINQNGPKEMGWRVTATNLNLNRDYLKADAPEMKQWLTLFNSWMPDFFIDVHATNGADYQYVLTYLMEVYGGMDKGLTQWSSEEFLPGMTESMEKQGFPVIPYVTFRSWHNPKSGLITQVAPPMLSQGYTSLRNRPALLIETHMLKPYKLRVEATYECLLISLNILKNQKDILRKKIREADNYLSSDAFQKEPFVLQYDTRLDDSVMVDFRGFRYTEKKSELSGGTWFDYSDTAEIWRIPWYNHSKPRVITSLPLAYVVPAEWTDIIRILHLHGINLIPVKNEISIPVRSYRLTHTKWQANPFEGRHPLITFNQEVITEIRTIPAGSVIVPVSQHTGRIIPHLLEPQGNGSLLYWGFFDAIFEQKEYAEYYIMEKLAPEMLSASPGLREEFEKKKASDTLFAKSPGQILNWFYAKSPYADNRRMIYPVALIDDVNSLRKLVSSGQ